MHMRCPESSSGYHEDVSYRSHQRNEPAFSTSVRKQCSSGALSSKQRIRVAVQIQSHASFVSIFWSDDCAASCSRCLRHFSQGSLW